MNKPITLREKLRLLVETDARPRPSLDVLSEELRSKGAAGLRPLALLDSMRLDLALFFHKYFAATLCAVLLLAGGGAWIAFSALGPTLPAAVHKLSPNVHESSQTQGLSTVDVRSPIVISSKAFSASAPSNSVSSVAAPTASATNVSSSETNRIYTIPASPSVGSGIVPDEEQPIAAIEPRMLPRIMPSATFVPIGVGIGRLQLVDAPLDYSGFTASISYEQPGIPADPAHPEFAATNENNLNYQAGYRFDRFQEAGIGYSQHIYRQISSTTATYRVDNLITGQTTYYHQTTWQYSDDPISLPGIYYTFHANNLEIFGIEPFATAFASKPNAGFLWRASAGLEWNAWDNLNAVISYSREQLNSGAYAAPQNIRNFFDFGLSYRLLP